MWFVPCYELIRLVPITEETGSQSKGPKNYLTCWPFILGTILDIYIGLEGLIQLQIPTYI